MKKVLSFLILTFAVSLNAADAPREWVVLNVAGGQSFKHATMLKVDDEALHIRHETGVARIPLAYLPVQLQEEFGYDPVKAKAAREKRLEAEREERRKIDAMLAAKRTEAVDRGKIKFELVNVKVVRVVEGGLIVHRYQPGGAAGETTRIVRRLVDNPRSIWGPEQQATVAGSSEKTLWFLEGVQDKPAEGDILVGNAGRCGTKEWSGRTLQRWIAQP